MDSIHVQALRRSMSIKGFPKRLKTGNTPPHPPLTGDRSEGGGGGGGEGGGRKDGRRRRGGELEKGKEERRRGGGGPKDVIRTESSELSKKGRIPMVKLFLNEVLDGNVDQSEQTFLTEEQINAGFCLGTWMMADRR